MAGLPSPAAASRYVLPLALASPGRPCSGPAPLVKPPSVAVVGTARFPSIEPSGRPTAGKAARFQAVLQSLAGRPGPSPRPSYPEGADRSRHGRRQPRTSGAFPGDTDEPRGPKPSAVPYVESGGGLIRQRGLPVKITSSPDRGRWTCGELPCPTRGSKPRSPARQPTCCAGRKAVRVFGGHEGPQRAKTLNRDRRLKEGKL